MLGNESKPENNAKELVIVHFGELWLRGKNRGEYINMLVKNIRHSLAGLEYSMQLQYDRLFIYSSSASLEAVKSRLAYVFGISNYEGVHVSKPEIKDITRLAVSLAKAQKAKKIKIIAHRSYKGFDFDSNDIIRSISDAARRAGIEPRLDDFDTPIYVNVTRSTAFLFTEKIKGAGGLPVGSEGKCVVLLSGGIDSPVAAWFAMKRGLEPVFVHVYALQNADTLLKGKMGRLFSELGKYCISCKSYLVPSYFFDAAAASAGAGRLTLVLLKHFMLKLAENVAKKEGAKAIVTGESLGQVASQTLENLTAESYDIGLPVLRPLIGFDKEEIISIAKKINTYNISIEPYKDVCSISARNPKTKSRVEEIKVLSQKIKLRSLITRSLNAATVLNFE